MDSVFLSLQHHDRRLLVMGMLVCLVASAAGLAAYARAATTSRKYRLPWAIAVGAMFGSGIWGSNCVWLMGDQAARVAGFEFVRASLSWIAAVAAVSAGALAAASGRSLWRHALGGAMWAATIVLTYFAAVDTVRLPATVAWRPESIALGAGLAAVLAVAAGVVAGDARDHRRSVAAGLLLALAVSGLHLVGAATAILTPAPVLGGLTVFSRDALALGLSVLGFMILLNGGGMLAMDRFSKAAALEALHHGLDQAPTALGFFDTGHRLVLWNRAYAQFMLDYGMRPEVGLTWREVVRSRVISGEKGVPHQAHEDVRRVGREDVHFGELKMPDGRWLDARLAPTGDGGFVAVLNDVTDLREMAARESGARKLAEDASRSKSEFLANVSHEIRTPLNAVLGMVQVMGRDRLSKVQRERLDVIDSAGRALLATLNDVLDLTKIEAGKLELEPHDFDLEEMVGLTAAAYAPLAAQKDLGFEVRIAPDAAGAWTGDSTRIRQVLSNLISNAVKFTTAGRVTVSVETRPDGLSFAVQDTGIGIAPDKLGAIFEKFTQADASMTRRFGGTGLGLAICHQLVNLMGGELTVTSQEGRGACFAFSVPLARCEARAPVAAAQRPQASDRPLKVLAAEDNPTNQLILSALMEPLGLELTMVGNGREAVEAVEGQAFDVILMDAQMPVMNGVEAALEIRRREAAARSARTPIIALTANVMQHQLAEYAEAGMDGHVAKPIEAPKLFEAIAAAVAAAPETPAAQASAA